MSEIQIHESFIEMVRKTGALAPEILERLTLYDAKNTDNVEFFGEPLPWQEYEAKDRKDAIKDIDELIDSKQKDLDAQNNATTPEEKAVNRKIIERIVLRLINTHKGRYADIKKALQEVDIDTLSDNYLLDDYFDEKYGMCNE